MVECHHTATVTVKLNSGELMQIGICRRCGKTDELTAARKLCRSCFRVLKGAGELDSFPALNSQVKFRERLVKKYGDGFFCSLSQLRQGKITQMSVSQAFGLTRQRISQIIKAMEGEK